MISICFFTAGFLSMPFFRATSETTMMLARFLTRTSSIRGSALIMACWFSG